MVKIMTDTADASLFFSLSQMCERLGLHAEVVMEWVEFGIVEPAPRENASRWVFSSEALARAERAKRLRRDLDLNVPGVALSLDLLDEIEMLHRQVASLKQQLQRMQGEENDA